MSNAIYKAITDAMADISPIAKEKRNKEQGFQYRGIDDVMNELSPILSKHKIFIYPEVVEKQRQERQTKSGSTLLYSILTIKYHFATDDGSEVCTTVVGEGMDSGDKASNKAMAVAFKYACLQMFCIPTDDMKDPDVETPPPSTQKQETPENPKSNREPVNKQAILDEMGAILKKKDPDGVNYFSDKELDMERDIAKAAVNTGVLQKQLERLKLVLEKREKEWKPIPFEDDIPEGMEVGKPANNGEMDIF
jgi:predicted component of type VI protein secretion system